MPSDEKDLNLPPSYIDSLRPSLAGSSTGGVSRGQNLLDTLTLTRASTIRSTIYNSILPILSSRAALGIPHTTLALLPSDIPLPPPAEKSEFSFDSYGLEGRKEGEDIQVLGFSGDEEPKVIRLSGDVHRTEFWRQRTVIEELERALRDDLNDGRLVGTLEVQETNEVKKVKKGLFGRGKKAEGQPGGQKSDGFSGEQVAVRVRLEEICLRTTNEFGLYDTVSRQCVVVKVDARC